MALVSPYLIITAEHDARRSLLQLHGELDAGNRGGLHDTVRMVLDEHSPRLLVLDISALSFTDCAGLSVIVWAHQRQAERGHRLVITGVQPAVRRLLHLTGLGGYLHVSPPDLAPAAPAQPLG